MTPTEPGFNAADLRNHAIICERTDSPIMMTPAHILALLAEVERLRDTEKVQSVMIRELERLNTELNDELGTAVQVLKLERDSLRAEVDRLRGADQNWVAWGQDLISFGLRDKAQVRKALESIVDHCWTNHRDADSINLASLRARLAAVERGFEGIGMADAIRACIRLHTYATEIPDEGEAYLWCVCGWRSDDWTDFEGAARHLHTHLQNAMHDAVRTRCRAALAEGGA